MPEVEISVVAPAYNEAGNLPEFVRRMDNVLKKTSSSFEIIVVNDASKDKTEQVLSQLSSKFKSLRPINHKKNKGQTGCFDSGFKAAKGEIIITMDSDLEVYPEDSTEFIRKMKEGADIVNGIRTNRKHTFYINLASRIYNFLMFFFFKSPVYDAASNYTAFRSKFVKGITLKHNDHRYIIPIAQRKGAKEIDEVVIRHERRVSGASKYKAMNKFVLGFFELLYAWLRIRVFRSYD